MDKSGSGQLSRDAEHVVSGGVQVQKVDRVDDPSLAGVQLVSPINIAFEELRELLIIGCVVKRPLFATDVVLAAGKRDRDELARFHKFQLLIVDLLAQSVDDGRLGVGGLKRRQDLAESLRQVNGNLGVQAVGVFQADLG